MKQDKPVSNSANKSPLFIYIRMVLGIIGVFAVLMCIGLFLYMRLAKEDAPVPAVSEQPEGGVLAPEDTKTNWGGAVIGGNLFEAPDKTNFLIAGTDAGGMLTDVMLVVCFDKHLAEFSVISMPRDTYTVMPPEDITILRNAGKSVPSGGVMKLNQVHSYAGKESGILFTQKQIERILGVKIDYYAEVSLQGFRDIVDSVGGIYMEIPAGGFYYKDPEQNLVIEVPEGMQLLDGNKAEGVVRYRNTYQRGDLQRIEVQHEFMKQFFAQALTKEKIIKNASGFLSAILNYVKTNFTIADAPKYLRYLDNLNSKSIKAYTLPGVGREIGGASYFIVDDKGTHELVNEIFYKDNSPVDIAPDTADITDNAEPAELIDIKKLKIQVLNGADKDGLAAAVGEELRGLSFNVINIGNSYGDKVAQTQILVKNDGDYSILTGYFNDSSVVISDPDMDERYDIIIIIGTSRQ